jgi:hypothetical protein
VAVSRLSILAFAVVLSLAALRSYQYPAYTSDEFQYMANAVAMHGAHAPEIHATVYREIYAGVPKNILDHLLGKDTTEISQTFSFRERERDPYRFAEFLPCFAVRPIFNELVYVLHYGFGMSLLRATVIIPVLSYWLMGWIALIWISRYTGPAVAALIASMLMITPPLWDLGRSTTPDAFSSGILLLGLFFVLEKQWIAPGLALLLSAVYIRTDNFLVVLCVLGYLALWRRVIDVPKAAVLGVIAVASVFLINHFAGDYGPAMLYYRAFVAIPLAPGELTPHFGLHDYFVALRHGTAGLVHENFIVFSLMGVVGLIRGASSAILGLTAIAAVFSASHFILYPLPEERFFGLFFVAMGISMASTLTISRLSATRKPVVQPSAELVA